MWKFLVILICFYSTFCSLLLKDDTETQFFDSEDNNYCDMKEEGFEHFNDKKEVPENPLQIDLLPQIRKNEKYHYDEDITKEHDKIQDWLPEHGNEFFDHVKVIRSLNSKSSFLDSKLIYLQRTKPKLASKLNYLNRNRRQVKDEITKEIFSLYDSIRVKIHELNKRMGGNIDKINLEENVLERMKPCKGIFENCIEPVHPSDLIRSKILKIRNKAYNLNRYVANDLKRFKREEVDDENDNLLDKEFPEIDPHYDEDNKKSLEPHIRKKRS